MNMSTQETRMSSSQTVPNTVLSVELISKAAGISIDSLSGLKSLNLHVRDRTFPKITDIDSLHACPTLNTLNLSYNMISRAVKLYPLKDSLTELNLAENRLTEISKDILELRNLKLLNLSGNQIEKVPADISALNRLVSLRISRNRLESLSDMYQLRALPLSKLRIDANPLALIPHVRTLVIALITSLESLDGVLVAPEERRNGLPQDSDSEISDKNMFFNNLSHEKQQLLVISEKENSKPQLAYDMASPATSTGSPIIQNSLRLDAYQGETPYMTPNSTPALKDSVAKINQTQDLIISDYIQTIAIADTANVTPVSKSTQASHDAHASYPILSELPRRTTTFPSTNNQIKTLNYLSPNMGNGVSVGNDIDTTVGADGSKRALQDLSARVEQLTTRLVISEGEKNALQQQQNFKQDAEVLITTSLATSSTTEMLKTAEFSERQQYQKLLRDKEMALEHERAQSRDFEEQLRQLQQQIQDEHAAAEHFRSLNLSVEAQAAQAKGAAEELRDFAIKERDNALSAVQALRMQLQEMQAVMQSQMKSMQGSHAEALQSQESYWRRKYEELFFKLESANEATSKAQAAQTENDIRIKALEASITSAEATSRLQENRLQNSDARTIELSRAIHVLEQEKQLWQQQQQEEKHWLQQRQQMEAAAISASHQAVATETQLNKVRNALHEQEIALSKAIENFKMVTESAANAELKQKSADHERALLQSQIEQLQSTSHSLQKSLREARQDYTSTEAELQQLRQRVEDARILLLTEEGKLKRISQEAAEKLYAVQSELHTSTSEFRKKEQELVKMEKRLTFEREESERKEKESKDYLERLQQEALITVENAELARNEQRNIQKDISKLSKQRSQLQCEVSELEDLLTSERGHRRTNEDEFKRHIDSLQRLLSETEHRWRGLKEEVRVLEAAAADARTAGEQQRRQLIEIERAHSRKLKDIEDSCCAKQEEAQAATRAAKASQLAVESAHAELDQLTSDARHAERKLSSVKEMILSETQVLDETHSAARGAQNQLQALLTHIESTKQVKEQEQGRIMALKTQLEVDCKSVQETTRKLHSLQHDFEKTQEMLDNLKKEVQEQQENREVLQQSREEVLRDLEIERRSLSEARTKKLSLENDIRRLDNEVAFAKERIADSVSRKSAAEIALERTRDLLASSQRELAHLQKQLLEAQRTHDEVTSAAIQARTERDRYATDLETTSLRLAEAVNNLRDNQTENRSILSSMRVLREELRLMQGQQASAVSALEIVQAQIVSAENTQKSLNEDVATIRESLRGEQQRLANTNDSKIQAEAQLRSVKAEVNAATLALESLRTAVREEDRALTDRRRHLQDATMQLLQVERDLRASTINAAPERARALDEIGQLGLARQAAHQRVQAMNSAMKRLEGDKPDPLVSLTDVGTAKQHQSNIVNERNSLNYREFGEFAQAIPATRKAPPAAVLIAKTIPTPRANSSFGDNQRNIHANAASGADMSLTQTSFGIHPSEEDKENCELIRDSNSSVHGIAESGSAKANYVQQQDLFLIKGKERDGTEERPELDAVHLHDLRESADQLRKQTMAVFKEVGVHWEEDF